jgi:hypothetical protein
MELSTDRDRSLKTPVRYGTMEFVLTVPGQDLDWTLFVVLALAANVEVTGTCFPFCTEDDEFCVVVERFLGRGAVPEAEIRRLVICHRVDVSGLGSLPMLNILDEFMACSPSAAFLVLTAQKMTWYLEWLSKHIYVLFTKFHCAALLLSTYIQSTIDFPLNWKRTDSGDEDFSKESLHDNAALNQRFWTD